MLRTVALRGVGRAHCCAGQVDMTSTKDWAAEHVNGVEIRAMADAEWARASDSGTVPQEPIDNKSAVRPWPVLSEAAKRGLAGEFARVATEDSEADPVAVMLTMLTGVGALMGRPRYMRVGDTEHHARLMTALVGATSRARKGSSWGP